MPIYPPHGNKLEPSVDQQAGKASTPSASQAALEALKKRLLTLGGDPATGFGGFQRPEFLALEAEWLPLEELLTAAPRPFGNGRLIRGLPNGCHDNARTLAAERAWAVHSGFALTDGIWRVHSWVTIPRTGRLVETTAVAELYVGVETA